MPSVESCTVAPHDALFTGLFLQEAAAKRYINLNKAVAPYRCFANCCSENSLLPERSTMLQPKCGLLLAWEVLQYPGCNAGVHWLLHAQL